MGVTYIWNPIKRYRIDNLLFAVFASFIIIILLIVIWFSYSFSSQEMANNTSFYQQALLDEINNQLRIQLNAIEQISLATSRNYELNQFLSIKDPGFVRHMTQLEIEYLLAQITYSSSNVESVDLYMENAPTSIQDFAIRLIDKDELIHQNWYNDLVNNAFTWFGEREIVTNKGQVPVISFARIIYTNLGKNLGVLVINMKAPAIHSIITGEKENTASNRLLVDLEGRSIIKTGNSIFTQGQIHKFSKSLKGLSGHMKLSIDDRLINDQEFLIVWSKFLNSDWQLIEVTPWETITSGSLKMAGILSLIGVITIFIALFFVLYISKQFIRPIRLLLTEMKKFTVNPKEIHLPRDYYNEFGVMFHGYRRLNNQVMELYQSLEVQYKRQKEAEIKALQAMINPHFLYNTLDQINWMAIEKGQEDISHVLELVGKMFRIGLSNGEALITIDDELTHMSCYIQIQQIRWGDGLEFIIDVPESIKNYYIPKLTLQPFVENAIMHGFHGRINGLIEIKAFIQDDKLLFTIEDNGVGIDQNQWKSKKNKTGGYGIRNVTERIDAFFGSTYNISIKNREKGGTTVYIQLPVIREKIMEYNNFKELNVKVKGE